MTPPQGEMTPQGVSGTQGTIGSPACTNSAQFQLPVPVYILSQRLVTQTTCMKAKYNNALMLNWFLGKWTVLYLQCMQYQVHVFFQFYKLEMEPIGSHSIMFGGFQLQSCLFIFFEDLLFRPWDTYRAENSFRRHQTHPYFPNWVTPGCMLAHFIVSALTARLICPRADKCKSRGTPCRDPKLITGHQSEFAASKFKANFYSSLLPLQLGMAICYPYESAYFPAPYADNRNDLRRSEILNFHGPDPPSRRTTRALYWNPSFKNRVSRGDLMYM